MVLYKTDTDRNDLVCHTAMQGTMNLAQASGEQVQRFLDSFDVVLSDCDGVIWYLERPIPGAMVAANKLQELGKRLYLVSNNSTISVDRYCEKTRQNGLFVKPDQVINPAKVISWYLKSVQFAGEAFVIASTPFRQILIDAGIKMAPDSPKVVEGDAMATIKAVQDRPSVKAVIVDFSLFFDWGKLAFCISCLKRKDVLYICGTLDEWVVAGRDTKVIGAGPLIDIITKYSGRAPIECAKPSKVLKDYALEICNIKDPKRCLFVGDSIHFDMKFATMCGFQKLFVDTGLDNIQEAEKSEQTRPEYYIPSLAMLQPLIDSLHNSVNDQNGN